MSDPIDGSRPARRLAARLRPFAALGLGVLFPAVSYAQDAAPASSAAPAKPKAVAGVTVQAAPQQAVRTSIDRRSYSVAGDLQGSGGSLADALRNIPGAEVDLQGNLKLRGGAVQVMIDGQPTALFSGQGGAQALQSMPADRIDRVEVITNPTAAFSPEGQAGIINLVTKKSAPAGVTGGMRANLGTEGRGNAAANLAYTQGKLTLTADGGWRRDALKFDTSTTGAAADPATGLADPRAQHEIANGPQQSFNGHVGFDYRLDPKTQLSGEARYNTFSWDRYDDFSFLSSAPGGAPLSAYTHAGAIDNAQNWVVGQMTLRHQFPGQDHDLVLFFNHTHIHYQNDNASDDLTTAPAPPVAQFQELFSRTNTDTDEFKADYTRPMPNKAQMKAGYDLRVVNALYDNTGTQGPGAASATPDPVFANLFRYGQMVNAGYVTYEQPVGDLTVLGGLRLEDERLSLDQITQGQTVRRDEVDLFPTLHLAYRTSNATQWVVSYSSRIQRPSAFDLDPFRNLADPYNIRMGNPDLKPQITQSFEGGWQYKKGAASYLATLFYRQSEHGVTNVVTDLGGGVQLTTRENLSNARTAGLELVAAAPVGRTLTYNVSADLYWNQIQAPALGAPQTRQDLAASGRGSLNWQPTKSDLIQFNGSVSAAQLTPQGRVDPVLITFFGYRHKFTGNFAVVGTVQDPFNLVRLNSYLDGTGLNERTATRVGFRAVFVGFTYTFGGRGRPLREPGFDFNAAPAAGGPP